MYATCLFCNNALGANESIEHFPVGRRLAYDAAAGRLWVVCRKCERWNLSPLETRWEAIEEAERLFRATRLRVVSDNIGMAMLNDGVELVRIGATSRSEFAAWRYGNQFGRRHFKFNAPIKGVIAASTIGAVVAVGAELAAHASPALASATSWSAAASTLAFAGSISTAGMFSYWNLVSSVPRISLHGNDGELLRLTSRNAGGARLVPANKTSDWHLTLSSVSVQPATGMLKRLGHKEVALEQQPVVTMTGEVAMRALGNILPAVNMLGGNARDVQDAVNTINARTDVQQLLRHGGFPNRKLEKHVDLIEHRYVLSIMEPHFRLALEMCLHEGDERRALDGELKQLEQRWREADEIAKIADGLFIPDHINKRVAARDLDDRNAQ